METFATKKISEALKLVSYFLFTLAILAIIYARHGYVFGASDQSETLPYILWLNNHSLYPSDFFLQNIIQHPFNERRFFVELLHSLQVGTRATSLLNYCVFVLHALATASLLWGIYFYMRERFNSFGATWIAILLPLLFLFNINTGANELYENSLNPSYVANILGLWAIFLNEHRKVFWAVVLIVLATFFQPLIGALIALVFFLSETAIETFIFEKDRVLYRNRLIACFIFFVCTAGIYLYALSHQISTPADLNLLMQIIAMRAPHHYLPYQFSFIGYAFMLACVIAIFNFDNYNDKVWTFFIVAGCIVYAVCVYYFESNFILNTQFFRMTIWIKFWGSMGLMRYLLNYLQNDKLLRYVENRFKRAVFFAGIVCTIIILPSFRIFKNKDYMFPFFKNTNPIVEISEHAKNATPINALFITPPDFEAFRFYSERNNFIDYKAILHDNAYLLEWQKRMKLIYNVGINNKEKGFQLIPIAKANYNTLSDTMLLRLCQQNKIDYVIRDTAFRVGEGFVKIDSAAKYAIYKIPHD